MVAVIKKYKILAIAVILIIIGITCWILLTRQDTDKIPLRGVFVINLLRSL